jgi:two-component system cell cycle response regulator
VTLSARLTAAFLAVVLGPVLLGAVLVGASLGAFNRNRAVERLDVAASGVQRAVEAACARLRVAAETAAMLGAGAEPGAAQQVVTRQLADGVRLVAGDGTTRYASPGLPAGPWADCAGTAGQPAAFTAFGARVQVRDPTGTPSGYADAVEFVDAGFVGQLATGGPAAVTVLVPAGRPPLSTERPADRAQVVAAAGRLHGSQVAQTERGRCVRRLAPGPGHPLPITLSVAREDPQGLYAVLVGVVVLAGLAAVVAAWWLARSTADRMTELASAVDRMAAGDLDVRVPVRSQDEIGRLGATINRMARETQGYMQALTASRDQLRGHLGLLGDTLSSTHDLDRILQVILQTASAATGAQAGVLLLLDRTTGSLIGQCGEGLSERGHGEQPLVAQELRIPVGEGLLGTVAAYRGARRGRVDRDGPVLSPSEPRCRTYVAVAFAASDGAPLPGMPGVADPAPAGPTDPAEPGIPAARGVLALYDRHGFDEFDDSDLVTLRTFAGQAAVALDNVRVHEEAQRLSLTDPLTGLANYRFLRESLRREVERAHRFGRTLAVLALDLDRFKEVNEGYGHAAGDAVLAEFARRLRVEIREVDYAFRQGGEEFVVLLPETDAAGAVVVAERLGASVRGTPVTVAAGQSGEPVHITMTVSIGIAVYPDHDGTGPGLLDAADDALYAAKTAGRDTYRTAQTRSVPVGPGGDGTGSVGPGGDGTGSAGRAGAAPMPTNASPSPVAPATGTARPPSARMRIRPQPPQHSRGG